MIKTIGLIALCFLVAWTLRIMNNLWHQVQSLEGRISAAEDEINDAKRIQIAIRETEKEIKEQERKQKRYATKLKNHGIEYE